MLKLKGITWNHSRGFTSIVACSQRFSELNPDVEISWEKRSLQAFADEPINKLAERFDFLIIDHPWAGIAARTWAIIPLDEHLDMAFLEDQRKNSVGRSHESYSYDGHQWALAIDAATPVAASRPDIFRDKGLALPQSYGDLLELSKSTKIAIPGIPQDTLMSFYMLCSTLGEDVCLSKDRVISKKIGLEALDMLRALGENIDMECYDWNPIKVYEAMTQSNDYIYSPFAYGYTNYARKGYASSILKFHDMVAIKGQKLITTLGGTGLAISSRCKSLDIAVKFAEFVGSPALQKGVFFASGGQPGHRTAWIDRDTNNACNNFFKDTLPALDRAFLRPRYPGHMFFQDRAGSPIREYMMKGGSAEKLLGHLDDLYKQSLNILD